MELYPLKSELVLPGDSIAQKFVEALSRSGLMARSGDIIAIASKAVSVSERRIVSLSQVKPKPLARKLARKYGMSPTFVETVLDEADAVFGGVPGVLLTLKNGDATANSGVDRKNAPGDSVVLWPVKPQRSAHRIRGRICKTLGKKVGLVIVDSRVTPLRLGTVGLAIASSGFRPTIDRRGIRDLYGRKVRFTQLAVADGIADAAHLLMDETRESIPFVLVRGAPVRLGHLNSHVSVRLPVKDCLYMSQMPPAFSPRIS